eukprot:9476090-Pyramimonas_sp.AAC.1
MYHAADYVHPPFMSCEGAHKHEPLRGGGGVGRSNRPCCDFALDTKVGAQQVVSPTAAWANVLAALT